MGVAGGAEAAGAVVEAGVNPVRGLKRLARMVFQRQTGWHRWSGVWGATRKYIREVGDGTGSSTVMAPLLWIARTFPEAPPALWRQSTDSAQEEQVRDHPLLRLLQRPNGFYTGRILWMATLADWCVDGNAYWLKLRTGTGQVSELWWVPSLLIEPKGNQDDASVFVDHYEYTPNVTPIKVDPSDVVHFRFGLDAGNPRKGYSPLKSILREVFTDDEAAAFTASLLQNMGVPGLIVSPDGDGMPSQEDVEFTKAYFKEMFSGDKRGEPLVMSGPTKVQQFGFSPEQLLLKELRRIPEERVTAVLGVPAIVAGLGAGLDRSTFTNYTEAREAAYEQNIIPTQGILSEDIRFQLLSDFVGEDVWTWRFGFDLSKVRVLQEDVFRQAQRLDLGFRGGWVTRAEARRPMGLEVRDTDDVYMLPLNSQIVTADETTPPAAPPPANGNRNGTGGADSRAIAEEVVRQMTAATS